MVNILPTGVSQVKLVPLSVAQKRSDIKYRMEAYEVEERERQRAYEAEERRLHLTFMRYALKA